MNVLHVIPAIAPRYGGPSAAVVGMCRSLRLSGISTLVATTDADGPARLAIPIGQTTDYKGIPAIFFHRQVSESYKWSAPLGAWLMANVAKFDVVHVHAVFSHSSVAAGRACRAAGVPYVVRPLGTLDPWSVGRRRFRKQVLFRLGAADLLAGAGAMHYTSGEERRLAESVVPRLPRGVVIPLGIDDDIFTDSSMTTAETPTPYLLSLSRIHEKKGLDLLINSFHRVPLASASGRWRLVIAGDGGSEYVASLKALAAAGEGRSRIEFVGWMDGADRLALMRGAGVVVSSSHQENFGISILEGMACGVPALVTPGFNLAPEIQHAQAGWVAERSEDALVAALTDAMTHPQKRRQRGNSARAFAAQFRWPSVAAALGELYASLVSAPAARVG